MTLLALFYYVNAFIALGATILALTAKNAVHGLLYFIVSILALAISFYLLDAPLTSALEVMVYAGAIMVLFVFVVMLLNFKFSTDNRILKAAILPMTLAALLFAEMVFIVSTSSLGLQKVNTVSVRDVAISLLSDYALGIEIASLILTAGLIGAFHVGRKRRASC